MLWTSTQKSCIEAWWIALYGKLLLRCCRRKLLAHYGICSNCKVVKTRFFCMISIGKMAAAIWGNWVQKMVVAKFNWIREVVKSELLEFFSRNNGPFIHSRMLAHLFSVGQKNALHPGWVLSLFFATIPVSRFSRFHLSQMPAFHSASIQFCSFWWFFNPNLSSSQPH